MERIAVVTDSSACLPPSLAKTMGIRVLPITVHLLGADHLDGGDDLPSKVYRALADDEPVKSSPPSVADYLAAIEDSDAGTVVVVTPAAEFTAMHQHAAVACELAGRRAIVIDSRTAAAGEGLVVAAGAQAAAGGERLAGVIRCLEEASSRVDLVASLAGLGVLRRSGLVPAGSLEARSREGSRIVFRMRAGAVEPLASVACGSDALDAIEAEWTSGGGWGATRHMVFHADCPDLAQELAERLGDTSAIAGFSAAMAIHTGPGVVGAAWLPPMP